MGLHYLCVLAALLAWACGERYAPEFAVPGPETSSYNLIFINSVFDVIAQILVPFIEQEFSELIVGDFSGTASTSIGSIDYSITNIFLSQFDLGDVVFTLNDDTDSLLVEFLNSTVEGDFDYAYQLLAWPYLAEEGTGRLIVDGFQFSFELQILQDAATGGATLNLVSLNIGITEFTLELDGGLLATIVDFLEGLFEDTITEAIASLLAASMTAFCDEYFAYADTTMLASCTSDICFDYRLAQDISITDNYGTARMGGTFYWGPRQDTYVAPDAWPVLPSVVNNHLVQALFGANSFVTYFDALTAAGLLADTACDAADSTACGMTADGAALLAADSVAAAFPEFAAAHPGSAAAVTVALVTAPAPNILYSAIKVPFEATLAVAPFDTAAGTAGAVAATFTAVVTTAGDFDFLEFHGEPADAVIPQQKWSASIEFDKYAAEITGIASSIGDIAVTSALESWAEDVFFGTCLWGAWGDVFNDAQFPLLRLSFMEYLNRSVVYDPDYVALTFNVSPNWDFLAEKR